MVDRQEQHRQRLEEVTIRGNDRRATQGIWIGAGLSVLFLVAAFVLGILGHQVAAGVIGGVDIVGLATVFVVGRREQRVERREKAKLTSQPPPSTGGS